MRVQNFRSLKDVEISFQNDLTILIGENDSGKSSVLDVLELVLSAVDATRPQPTPDSDFHVDPSTGEPADRIEVELTFAEPEAKRSATPSCQFRAVFNRGQVPIFKDTSGNNIDVRTLRSLGLPFMERYRARDYQRPEDIAIKTLRSAYGDSLELPHIKNQIDTLRRDIQDILESHLSDLRRLVSQYVPRTQSLRFDPILDFAKALTDGQFMLDRGHGAHPVSGVGDGTKRRFLMAVLEWDRNVRRQRRGTRPLILAYDEPDTNLDFGAQRIFFKLLDSLATDRRDIQIILCTHSVPMIDSAPITSLVLLSLDQGITNVISPFPNPNLRDDELSEFLENLSIRTGLTNSALLFERCYFLVEGETEHTCLPRLYRRKYGRLMRQDGIVPICLSGCGNTVGLWRFFLQDWKKDKVITLLDADAADRHASYRVGQLFKIGQKEFEDAFPDDVWSYVLNAISEWQRMDDYNWHPDHIADIRQRCMRKNIKFSRALITEIQKMSRCEPVSKPRLGEALGNNIRPEDIPEPIVKAFEAARKIAGVT
jgi:predicted ATP-dependent endonuclease of OLD family